MAIFEVIFRAYNIREIVETALTPAATWQIGLTLAIEALKQKQTSLVISHDCLLSCPVLLQAMSEGKRTNRLKHD